MRELILHLPGLFGAREGAAAMRADLHLPALDLLRARADRIAVPDIEFESALLRAFGLTEDEEHGVPLAPLALLGETGERHAGFWLRADPVHIQAGIDKAVMLGSAMLALSQHEAVENCAQIAAQMNEEGLAPRALAPLRWYQRWPHVPRVRFSPLPETLGGDLYPHMPQGEEGRFWRGLLNHVQMVLHASETNAAHRAVHKPEISGLWFWGGGELPPVRHSGDYAAVWSDDPYVRGLALNAEVQVAMLPAHADAWLEAAGAGRHLATLDALRAPLRLADVEGWRAAVMQVHEQWIEPLVRALRAGELDVLKICPGEGAEYHISRRVLRWRWWRRSALSV
ncbi:MAG: hypothetical protein LBV36_03130 [Chromatiales bacterium]|jgi:hypothetical protein|nr:hypothetical protein [Chromatiales bacterium]